MSFALYRAKQFGIRIEATPGVAETLTSADYGLELTELATTTGVEAIAADAFKGTISSSPDRIGKKTAGATIAGELKNSGVLNTLPRIADIFQASRMVRSNVKGMVVTGVTGTPKRGITVVTGGTSGAKGTVIKLESGKLYVYNISGTFQSGEPLTSNPVGFAATTGAQDVANTGFVWTPSTTVASEKCATVNIIDGGIYKPFYGAVASFGLELNTESYPKWTGTLSGVLDSANWGDAHAEVTGVTYENHLPPVVNAASLVIDGTVTPVASAVTIDLGNTLSMIKDLNSVGWLKYGSITQRAATGTITMLALDPSVYSAYQALFAGQTASLEFTIGSGAGNAIEIVMPTIQYSGLTDQDQEGFLASQITFKIAGNDNEICCWFR